MKPQSILAIQTLIYRYAELIDDGDYKGIGDLFRYARIVTEDSNGPIYEGSEAVTQMYAGFTRLYPDDNTPKSKHVITNLILEIADDDQTATARSYYTVFQKTDALPLQPIITGKYRDIFERVSGDGDLWNFKERVIIVDQIGDLSQHMLLEIP